MEHGHGRRFIMDLISIGAALKKAYKYTDEQVAALAGGVKYKGSKTFAELPTASEENKGFMYTVTDKNNHEYLSDGSQWLDLNIELDSKVDKAEGNFSLGKDSNGVYIMEEEENE